MTKIDIQKSREHKIWCSFVIKIYKIFVHMISVAKLYKEHLFDRTFECNNTCF